MASAVWPARMASCPCSERRTAADGSAGGAAPRRPPPSHSAHSQSKRRRRVIAPPRKGGTECGVDTTVIARGGRTGSVERKGKETGGGFVARLKSLIFRRLRSGRQRRVTKTVDSPASATVKSSSSSRVLIRPASPAHPGCGNKRFFKVTTDNNFQESEPGV